MRYLLLLFVVAIVAGCDAFSSDQPRVNPYPVSVDEAQYSIDPAGFKYFYLKTGAVDAAVADSGDVVGIHYTIWLSNGSLWDSSRFGGPPLSFKLRSGALIEGIELGVMGMRVGSEQQLVLPPQLAYGEKGWPEGGMPPNATLIVEVELKSVKKP